MRKRLRKMVILLAVCALSAAGLYALYPGEPSFEGRRLSEWILTAHDKEPGPEKEKALAVVRQLGLDSIPLLLHWLRNGDDPSWNWRVFELKSKGNDWLAAHHIIKPHGMSVIGGGPNHRTIAGYGLAELDPAGKRAVIPVLIQMLGDKKHKPDELSEIAGTAYLVLPTMAPESIAPLMDALSSQDVQVWTLAAGALGHIGPDAKAAIPALEKRLKDNDANTRVGAAETIVKLGGDPRKFIPVVIQSLPEVKWDFMDYSLDILVRYKEQAKAAVPVLLTILSNTAQSTNITNMGIRNGVMNALREIDPEAADKAGVR